MPTTLRAKIAATIEATYKNILDLSTIEDRHSRNVPIELGNGTGANLADLLFHDTRTIAASGSEDLDLAGGLTNPLTGAAMTFVELRAVIIRAATGNTNNVRFSRPASNGVPLFLAAGDGIDIPPGGQFMWACAADGKVTVTAGTGDLLTVANSSSGTTVTYDITIVGTSA